MERKMKWQLSNDDEVHSDASLVRSITTSAQREIFSIEQERAGAKCNLWFYRIIRGPLDVDILSNVIKRLTSEIALFKTRFCHADGELWQIYDRLICSNIRIIDVSDHQVPLEMALKMIKCAGNRRSCITSDALYEFTICTMNEKMHILHAQFHHAIMDVRSWAKLESMIAAAYNGFKKGQPISVQPDLCFDALAQANAAYIASNEHQQDEQFWKAYVQPLKRHAYTHRNIDLRGMKMNNRCVQTLSINEHQKLRHTAIELNVSESNLYIGVSTILLRSLIGSEYVSVSLQVHGTHSKPGAMELGMTSNTLPLLLHIPENATLKEVLMHVAEETKSVLMHQRYRIEEIRRLANYSSSESFGPQINVMCYDHGDELEGCNSSSHFGANNDTNDLQISFWSGRPNGRLDIMFDDIADGHTQKQLASLKDRLISILDLIVYASNSKIGTLDALDERYRQIYKSEQFESFYANRRAPIAGGFVQWNRCADDLVRFVNANTWVGSGPNPFATTKVLLPNRVINIKKLKAITDFAGSKKPGTVLAIKEDCWHVTVADGVAEISDFFDENGQTKSAQTLARQYDLLENSQLPIITAEQADWLNDMHMQTIRSKPYWSQRIAEFEPCTLSIAHSSSNKSPLWASASFQILPSADFNATELLAAWLIYIARDTKLSQLQIGWDATESNNQYRDNNAIAKYIFAKTVPFSTVIDLNDTFSSVVTNIKKDCNQLVNSLPCFTDLFVRHTMSSTHHLSGKKMYDLAVSMIETQDEHLLENTDLDVHSNLLTLQINKGNGSFRCMYDSNRISEKDVKRISSQLLVLLASAKSVDQAQKPVGKLDILPKTERDLLLNVWNQRETTKSAKNCIRQMFAQHRLLTTTPFRHVVAEARFDVSEAEHIKFFSEMLGDIDSPTLPFGLSDVYQDGIEINEANLTVPHELSNQLRILARRFRVTLASLCHLAWAQVLAHTSGNESVVFGTVLYGRLQSGEGNDNAMGLLINTLPLRLDIDNNTVENAVCKAHSQLSALLSHEYAPLALAQRCSALPANQLLFSALLNYRHANQTENVTQLPAGNYPLSMSLDDNDNSLILSAEVTSPISATRICAYMQLALASLADALSHTPQRSIRALSVMPLEEREMLLYDFNKTTVNYPPVCCLHQLFEAQVEQNGQTIAVEDEDEILTYDELNTQANQLAYYLIKRGVKPDDRVAVCVKRSTKLIVALLGVLKSGGAYVPLDPVYTSQQLTNILEDSEPVCLLADDTGRKALGSHQVRTIDLDEDLDEDLPDDLPTRNPDPKKLELSPTNLAYVIYTSDSTGKPTGVMIEHQTAHNFAHSITSLFNVTSNSRVLQFASCGFDTSLEEIIMAITTGACLCIPSEEVRRMDLFNYMTTKNITHAEFPPAVLHNLQDSMDLTTLEVLLLSALRHGEAPSLSVLQMASSCAKIFNLYGPTETTITATNWLCPTNFINRSIPIGRPLSNIKLYLLDARGEPVPLGVDGELYIGGICVARGYLNRPELTAERFLPDPFSEIPGARMYRTGDMARYLPDSNMVFIERIDQHMKIRRFRIETGEIETHLLEHSSVCEAVVLPWKSKPNTDAQLFADVVAEQDSSLAQKLHTYLTSLLPDYWSELLGIESISRHDNSFELGGLSMLVMRFVNLAKKLCNIAFFARGLFSIPMLKSLAEKLTISSDKTTSHVADDER